MALVSADVSSESEVDRLAAIEAALFIIFVLVDAEADPLVLMLADADCFCESDKLTLTES